jgi:hypothetical protein
MHAKWLVTWITALALAAAGWCAFEAYWRHQGYAPTVMDSFDLWAQMRKRVVQPAPPVRVALLGASRVQYGLSPESFKAAAAGTDPVMLSVNGHYPLATLRDLAADERFNGIALVGIDSRGFYLGWHDMQQKYVDYFHKEFSPARDIHRSLLTRLQPHLIAARPDFAAITLINRYFNGYGAPNKEYVTFQRDRAGGTYYSKSNVDAIRSARVAELREHYKTFIAPTPEQWLRDNRDVVEWVKRINARGGRVVFYREPVSGEHFELDESRFPRAQFWDQLARIMPATMIEFQDYATLRIDTPDTSHIDAKDIDRHTRALVEVLRDKGVLPR